MSAPKMIDVNAPMRTVCRKCAVDWVTFEKIGEGDSSEVFVARPMGIIGDAE